MKHDMEFEYECTISKNSELNTDANVEKRGGSVRVRMTVERGE